MFSGIAPWYDFLNRLLSLRRDVIWRQELVEGLGLAPQATVLDLAAGTLDVSLEIISQKPDSQVAAADFSLAMLFKGKEKLQVARADNSIFPVAADAYALPFTEARFDAVTIAFGIRNLPDRITALKEMHRVLSRAEWWLFWSSYHRREVGCKTCISSTLTVYCHWSAGYFPSMPSHTAT